MKALSVLVIFAIVFFGQCAIAQDNGNKQPGLMRFVEDHEIVRISAGEQASNLKIQNLKRPCLPPSAFQARLTFPVVVWLDVLIGTDGTVKKADTRNGKSLIAAEVIKAVMNWKYKPLGHFVQTEVVWYIPGYDGERKCSADGT